MILSLIVAMSKNRVIGNQGKIPWHLPEDLAHFKKTTMGHPIIMGRKTFDSIGKPLPERKNIVITRNPEWKHEGILRVSSLEDALKDCEAESEVFIIGGGEIYAQAYPKANRLILTVIEKEFEGDTFFPFPFEKDFQIVSKTSILISQKEKLPYRFEIRERKTHKKESL